MSVRTRKGSTVHRMERLHYVQETVEYKRRHFLKAMPNVAARTHPSAEVAVALSSLCAMNA